MLPVGITTKNRHVGSDLLEEEFTLGRVSNVYHLLDNIVGKLIFHHCVQCSQWPSKGISDQSQLNNIELFKLQFYSNFLKLV